MYLWADAQRVTGAPIASTGARIREYGMKRQSGDHDRPREARLRAASAHLYPGITPEVWIQAATMADIVWARRLQVGTGSLAGRVLAGLEEALAGHSISQPFDFDPGTRKHTFGEFSILLRDDVGR